MLQILISLSELESCVKTVQTCRFIDPVLIAIRSMANEVFNLHHPSSYHRERLYKTIREMVIWAEQELDAEYYAACYPIPEDAYAAASSALDIATEIFDFVYNQSVIKNRIAHLKRMLLEEDHRWAVYCLYSALDIMLLGAEELYSYRLFSPDIYSISIS